MATGDAGRRCLGSRQHQGSRTLEQDRPAITMLQFPQGREPIRIHLGGLAAEEAAGLAGVRRQYPVVPPPRRLRQQVQGIRIDDQRAAPVRDCRPQAAGPGFLTETRTHGHCIRARQQGVDVTRRLRTLFPIISIMA